MNYLEKWLKTKEAKNTGSIKTYTTAKACYVASCMPEHKNNAFMFGLGFYINGILIKFE